MPQVLIIDDNASVALALDILFSMHDIKTVQASTPAQGLQCLANDAFDLVIQDMNFEVDTTSGEEGVALFHDIRARYPDLPVILLTAWTRLDVAVDLVRAGAADYLGKPWDDQKLLATVRNLLELGAANRMLAHKAQRERRQRRELEHRHQLNGYVWGDPTTERVIEIACQVARAEVPILITGPNGAGKERIAEIVQANSSVKNGPFVVVNCGALPAELIEAELFGVEAGAYTGAHKAREGKFEAADGGTLFLDEIGNLPLPGQMKLLRVLETGRFQRLGSNQEIQVKVRVISATNADLAAMIAAGSFRQDLYYRLNLIELQLPALSQRPGDIVPLAEFFLEGRKALSPQAIEAMLAYGWPGNVRELKNLMHRALLLARSDVIEVSDLGLSRPATPAPEQDLDRATIEQCLTRHRGVVAQAAAELGLSRQALYRRMERLGIVRHA